MGARYFGSLTAEHGTVVGIYDCDCRECVLLEPWDVHRKFELWVCRDRDQSLTKLCHVRNGSFTGWRS